MAQIASGNYSFIFIKCKGTIEFLLHMAHFSDRCPTNRCVLLIKETEAKIKLSNENTKTVCKNMHYL